MYLSNNRYVIVFLTGKQLVPGFTLVSVFSFISNKRGQYLQKKIRKLTRIVFRIFFLSSDITLKNALFFLSTVLVGIVQ